MAGLYIVFEGVVGTGKSTQSKLLTAYLKVRYPDREVLWTREPGGSEIAEAIRKLVQGTPFNEPMDPICEAYLYAAARAQSLRTTIKPVLERDGVVIADRSFLTSVGWQGFGHGLGFETIMNINATAIEGLLPDVVVHLDLNLEQAMSRTFDAAGDKFEKFPPAFFAKCRDGYAFLGQHENFRSRWMTIEATGNIEDVFCKILQSLGTRLP